MNAAAAGGYTALMSAAYYGHHAVLQALILAGANVNFASTDGSTALTRAESNSVDQVEKVQALIAAGANVNAADISGADSCG